jgi:hypothetical protein
MKYTLNTNIWERLDNWQEVTYDLCGKTITECHRYNDGDFQPEYSFVQVYDNNGQAYFMDGREWGTMEHLRDLAEELACDGQCKNTVQIVLPTGSIQIVPNREEVCI